MIKKAIIISLVSVMVVLMGLGILKNKNNVSANDIQAGIAAEVIRFHVIANSDSDEDQELKFKVRDAVIAEMSMILSNTTSINETRALIQDNLEYINSIAENTLKENDSEYPVKSFLTQANFPTKVYGDIVLPTGEYEALRIEIGDAKGQNWWCVMFPPLCFVDVTHGVVPEESKQELKNVLTEEEYNSILLTKSDKKIPVKIKFKIAELYNNSASKGSKDKFTLARFIGK